MRDPDATASEALAQAHRTIREGAEVSKRAIAAHRRALRAQRRALDELEEMCAQLGIEVRVETTKPKEARSDGQD